MIDNCRLISKNRDFISSSFNNNLLPILIYLFKVIKMPELRKLLIISVLVSLAVASGAFHSSCPDNVGRSCPSSSNRTDYLLSMKKGGTDVLSTQNYLYDFFLCEEYNFDCGYLPEENSYINIANGVALNMTTTDLRAITTVTTTYDKISPYVGTGLMADYAKCGLKIFPLTLTVAESQQVLDGYMARLATNVSNWYNVDRDPNTTVAWSKININIRTAVLQKFKTEPWLIRDSQFWNSLVRNNFTDISAQLKLAYSNANQQMDLHAAYMIDSVTQKCNKLQSVNFLVDQSGSIGAPGFQLALQFLGLYVNQTNDDFSKMSIHFYDNTFEPYIDFNTNKSQFQRLIPIKPYRARGTLTGTAMNQTIDRIVAANYKKGLPKILIVMTDGASFDSVVQAAKRARDNNIVCIAVGIGLNVNDSQLLEIAETRSNLIKVSSYADLPKLVQFISNYFCKQIITITLGETIEGNFVRVPESPSYFRVIKSPADEGRQYELDFSFDSDPVTNNQSVFQSQIDPFPDEYTEYGASEYYNLYPNGSISSNLRDGSLASSIPRKVYFIKPENQVTYTVKKKQTADMNVTVSYIAVRGNNLGFNVSLKVCSTLSCDVERALYNQSASNRIVPRPTPNTTNDLIIIPEPQDMSIFIAIGSALGALMLLCLLCIGGLRKFGQEEEKKKRQRIAAETTLPTQQQIEEGLMPATSTKKLTKNADQTLSQDSSEMK